MTNGDGRRGWIGLIPLWLACGQIEPASGEAVPNGTDPGDGVRVEEPNGGEAVPSGTDPGDGVRVEEPNGGDDSPGNPNAGSGEDPGGELGDPTTTVIVVPSPELVVDKARLDEALEPLGELDSAAFAERTAVAFETLPYDPSEAIGLDLIQSSNLALSDGELARLAADGFVTSGSRTFPTFTYGYQSIYADDLPLYVSADSILYAVHRSYSAVLKGLELTVLMPALDEFLTGLRSQLAGGELDERTRADLDVFLSVASGLLAAEFVAPGAGGDAALARSYFDACQAAEGVERLEIFGVARRIDFSQCTPRGHYAEDGRLRAYFQAMMWLGRIDFRLLETQPDGSQTFHRRQLESVLALAELVTPELRRLYAQIDGVITAFIGEHDYMTLSQAEQLASDLGLGAETGLESLDDQQLAQAIVDGQYGTQRISSHYMVTVRTSGTLPLSSSFALFGQRYAIDSHVTSNVVFDRVKQGQVLRMLPDPLDVAYAALQNDQAGMLLAGELERYDYAGDLSAMRLIVEAETDAFWEDNLYNRWLSALRELSPGAAWSTQPDEALPAIAKTEAWGRRVLNTQLASWAELRHDTILYVKQSYTAGIACEFPDAYVDPYPRFFAQIEGYATHAQQTFQELELTPPEHVADHFARLRFAAGVLREMAEHQQTGLPHSEEHLQFINRAVTVESGGCGVLLSDGWYPELFADDPLEWNPTIADVHTQPTDEAGNQVGNVLHVATGNPRLMVVTVETCSGPQAYAGLASSYYERVERDFKRLTDDEWHQVLQEEPQDPPAPPWFAPLLGATAP